MAKRLPTNYSHLTDEELRQVETTTLRPGDREMLNEEFGKRIDILAGNLREKESQVVDLTLQSRVLSKVYKELEDDVDFLAKEAEAHRAEREKQSIELDQGTPSKDQKSEKPKKSRTRGNSKRPSTAASKIE